MHLGNGIICPVTGIPMLLAMGAAAYYSFRQAQKYFSKDKILPTVVLTMFVFALQMINFSIPSADSSGHIIGGVLLAVILGPYVAFLAMSCIILVQAIFFSDGGLLALGCNIFNMGFLACFVAYPLIYKPLEKMNKPVLACLLTSIIALQLGSVFAVFESVISSAVVGNIFKFTALMQTLHLPIGIIEGLFTSVIVFAANKTNVSRTFSCFISVFSFILAGIIVNYASTKPDGLEWALLNISDSLNYQTQNILYSISNTIQTSTSLLSSTSPIFANLMGTVIISFLMCMLSKLLLLTNKGTENNG